MNPNFFKQMKKKLFLNSAISAVNVSLISLLLFNSGIIYSEGGQELPAHPPEGEFEGFLLVNEEEEIIDVGLSVTVHENNTYHATLYYGGLPENTDSESYNNKIELQGMYRDFTLRFTGNSYRIQFIHGRYTALDENNNYRGHLERVVSVNSAPGQNF